MMRTLKIWLCVAYGEFLIFIHPLVEFMPGWVQDRFIDDLNEMTRLIQEEGR